MSSESYTFAVQNTIKAAPYVNMVFISFECGINLISINNDSPNLQIFVSGAGKGYAPQKYPQNYILMSTPLCRAVMLLWFFFLWGKHLFHGLFVRSVSTYKVLFFFFPLPNRDHNFGGSISHIFKCVLSTLGKPYDFFCAWSELEMNSTIHRVLGIAYPVTNSTRCGECA